MKKVISILLIVVAFISCKKKFEEGQGDRLTSANKRIKGDWELQKFSINGIDSTLYYNSIFNAECTFSISPPFRNGDYGGVLMVWGSDTNKIYNARLWYGNAKYGSINAEVERDSLPSYFLYSFCKSWYSEPFDIRYLTNKKLILQIKPSDNYIQRLEFKKL